jgi:hypothetical protein
VIVKTVKEFPRILVSDLSFGLPFVVLRQILSQRRAAQGRLALGRRGRRRGRNNRGRPAAAGGGGQAEQQAERGDEHGSPAVIKDQFFRKRHVGYLFFQISVFYSKLNVMV